MEYRPISFYQLNRNLIDKKILKFTCTFSLYLQYFLLTFHLSSFNIKIYYELWQYLNWLQNAEIFSTLIWKINNFFWEPEKSQNYPRNNTSSALLSVCVYLEYSWSSRNPLCLKATSRATLSSAIACEVISSRYFSISLRAASAS